MAGKTILTPAQRTALFDPPSDLATIERLYTLGGEEHEEIFRRRRPANRLGFAVQLCYLREPGRALRHQVTDLAQAVRAEVQEYRLYRGVCGHCRKTHESRLPAGVPRGQIGPRALALIGALGTRYHLTQDKIRTLLGEVLGVRFSLGAISQAQGLVARALQAPVQQAAARP